MAVGGGRRKVVIWGGGRRHIPEALLWSAEHVKRAVHKLPRPDYIHAPAHVAILVTAFGSLRERAYARVRVCEIYPAQCQLHTPRRDTDFPQSRNVTRAPPSPPPCEDLRGKRCDRLLYFYGGGERNGASCILLIMSRRQ